MEESGAPTPSMPPDAAHPQAPPAPTNAAEEESIASGEASPTAGEASPRSEEVVGLMHDLYDRLWGPGRSHNRWLRTIDEQKEKLRAAVESGESDRTVRALQRGVTGLERQYGQWIIDYEAAGCPVTVHSPQAFSSPGEVREGHALDGIPVSPNPFDALAEDPITDGHLQDDDVDVDTLEVDITGLSSQGSNATDPSVSYVRAKAKRPKPSKKRRKLVKFSSKVDEWHFDSSSHCINAPAKSAEGVQSFPIFGCKRERVVPAVRGPCLAAAKKRGEDVGKPDGTGQRVFTPRNFKEAKQSPQWELWHDAMLEEMDSLESHGTWDYAVRTSNMKVIPCHWVYALKTDSDGQVNRYKARLVADGNRQILGLDVNEIYAPTASFAARRVLLSVAAARDMEVHQVDIKTAFLNGDLEEDVYMRQPPGFDNGDSFRVCKLKKALYGLRQAPRQWWLRLGKALAELGFVPLASDAGLYVNKTDPQNPVYLGVFVDDIIICANKLSQVTSLKEELGKLFEVHDLGEVKDFLGCHLTRDRANRILYMNNSAKIRDLAESFGLDGNTRSVQSPMSPGFVMSMEPLTVIPVDGGEREITIGSGTLLEPGNRYNELLGSLLYIANTTRPDISLAVSVLSRYRSAPTTAHWNEGLRVVRYLKDTEELQLRLGGGSEPVIAYTDSDLAGCLDSRKSTSGFLVKVFGGVVSWGSKKQHSVSTSTVEAEFQAACLVVNEVAWLRGMLWELGIPVGDIPLHCDNSGSLRHLKDPVNTIHTKHIAIKFARAREAVMRGEVKPVYVGTDVNVADIFTKALTPTVFLRHRDSLGVVSMT
jgi:hypothetical protein